MAFTENKEFNSLTPGDIYTVSKEVKNLLNKLFGGNLSSIAFVRENEEGNYEIVGSEWIPSEGDVSPEVIDSIVHSYKKWQGSYIGGYDAVRSLGIFDPNEWQNNKSGVE